MPWAVTISLVSSVLVRGCHGMSPCPLSSCKDAVGWHHLPGVLHPRTRMPWAGTISLVSSILARGCRGMSPYPPSSCEATVGCHHLPGALRLHTRLQMTDSALVLVRGAWLVGGQQLAAAVGVAAAGLGGGEATGVLQRVRWDAEEVPGGWVGFLQGCCAAPSLGRGAGVGPKVPKPPASVTSGLGPRGQQGCPKPCQGVSIPEPSPQRTPRSPDYPPAPPACHLPLRGPQSEGPGGPVPCGPLGESSGPRGKPSPGGAWYSRGWGLPWRGGAGGWWVLLRLLGVKQRLLVGVCATSPPPPPPNPPQIPA
ncbi:cuticle collagen 40-like [Falco cherrug]|uniref:cuticle collagen 40-like n=1 Tax=Falco cherrug TaxID=345164 RepID=UPI002479D383|nr:cuticle collagen 40-like [Falco cherrug]